jgi:DnaD/phage-associated family protein
MTRRTKKVIIKEELVELTGDYKLAIVLNQMIYWSERVADFDMFIKEEKDRLSTEKVESNILEYQHGWIYKTSEDLAGECMITNSEATMRRYLDKLISCGWLSARRNPKYKWDKTMQYRVNVTAIQKALFVMGFALEGYRIDFDLSEIMNDESNFQNDESNFHGDESNFHGERAIPEITSEITTKKKEEEAPPCEVNPFSFFEENGFGTIGGYMAEKIGQWCDDLSPELVLEAMKIAVERCVKNWSYVERILRDWSEKKFKTVDQVHAAILAFRENQAKQRDRPKNYQPKRTEMLPDWFDDNPQQQVPKQNNSDAELEAKRKQVEENLKKLHQGSEQ